jgi:hypothetical protein
MWIRHERDTPHVGREITEYFNKNWSVKMGRKWWTTYIATSLHELSQACRKYGLWSACSPLGLIVQPMRTFGNYIYLKKTIIVWKLKIKYCHRHYILRSAVLTSMYAWWHDSHSSRNRNSALWLLRNLSNFKGSCSCWEMLYRRRVFKEVCVDCYVCVTSRKEGLIWECQSITHDCTEKNRWHVC